MKYESTLNLIYSNEIIMRDLKALFDEVVERNIPEVTNQSDTDLGQQYRAYKQAKRMIKDAFEVIESLDTKKGTGTGVNYT